MLSSQPIFKCDPSLHNLPLWHKVLRLARVSGEVDGALAQAPGRGEGSGAVACMVDGQVDDLRLRVAQIARKQRNLKFADRLLREDKEVRRERGGGLEQSVLSSGVLQAKMEMALLSLATKEDPLALLQVTS